MKTRIPGPFEQIIIGYLVFFMAVPPSVLYGQAVTNSPPVLPAVTNRVVNVGQRVAVRVPASDPDLQPR
jgi:hypothetical protein